MRERECGEESRLAIGGEIIFQRKDETKFVREQRDRPGNNLTVESRSRGSDEKKTRLTDIEEEKVKNESPSEGHESKGNR